jgi:hypothetical protein
VRLQRCGTDKIEPLQGHLTALDRYSNAVADIL